VGPYVLSEHDEGRSYTLRANSNYYGGKPAVEQLVGLVIPSASEAVERFKKGQLEVATQLSTAAHLIEADPELRAQHHAIPFLRTFYLGMNTARFPTQRVGLRRAIAQALSQAKLVQGAGARGKPASSFVPPGVLGFDPQGAFPFDPEKARQELAREGLAASTLPELELMVSDAEVFPALGKQVAEQLRSVLGLRIRLNVLPIKAYTVRRRMKTAELFLSSWVADYPSASNFLSVFVGSSGNNFTNYAKPEFDTALESASGKEVDSQREAGFRAAQRKLLREDAVIVPLLTDLHESLIARKVQGVEVTPLNYLFFRRARLEGEAAPVPSASTPSRAPPKPAARVRPSGDAR
jgi:ABC-type oligopeptide transport system substrate-binding subunit